MAGKNVLKTACEFINKVIFGCQAFFFNRPLYINFRVRMGRERGKGQPPLGGGGVTSCLSGGEPPLGGVTSFRRRFPPLGGDFLLD